VIKPDGIEMMEWLDSAHIFRAIPGLGPFFNDSAAFSKIGRL